MAKALLGHVGIQDPRLVAELTRLRSRVRELESELAEVRATQLLEQSLRLPDAEPALT